MAYTTDAVRAKLSTLSETQDSIVSTAQWLLFHRRQADRTAQAWLSILQAHKDVSKRLNLIYLVNEVVQQSRARGKQDFLLAFEPIVAEGTASAYKGANESAQGKIRRVVEVWRQRQVFTPAILDAVEARLGEVDRGRSAKSGGKLGGSLFWGGSGGNMPVELEGVGKCQAAVTKADVVKGPAVDAAEKEYSKMTVPGATLPTPPVHAARLAAVVRVLATAQNAVEASMSARKELLAGLEKLFAAAHAKLAEDETTATVLSARKETIEVQKKEVEDGIMRGLSNPPSPVNATPTSGMLHPSEGVNGDAERPETEGFTPPPPDIESFTPDIKGEIGQIDNDLAPLAVHADTEPKLEQKPLQYDETPPSATFAPIPVINGNLDPRIRQASTDIPAAATNGNAGDPRLKRRKMSHPKPAENGHEQDFFGTGAMGEVGVDEAGVEALLAG
ncbi:hypothetical protein LTR62_006464 [Meristemomyces frigidus]|uniref:CID domain-containing protein n=1 Tax=Meristemomyces frigidus TaxID=1508187 RepID=A0AAN7YMU4_9PEZI|nr:hypothetical protein LTR62_006464 [Meristemomyces frigidus]